MNKLNVPYAAVFSELSIAGGKQCAQTYPFWGAQLGSMIDWRQ
ncbi:hypothetical protein VIOR3934_21241 [Vibrio orientalis CIP 102891 = ATCC 33934]|uniref:Uncharacterized protein n=1 Tax=Vibrio orientalis CIP 102891 = ATCC 33934 TaxID=675816 RepID=C9QF30_VIBOR|nr:hypothetical protein VIA_001900 [Vibrio orientalis CIP 102891 = ATCC 33934]EGU51439.1 hypothetical protein VIOR3934_21241 [Vibrio orientalis CIP 102891 = ATCC 33934]